TRSMDYGTPTKLRYAKQVAAALGFVGLVNLDRVTITGIGGTSSTRSPMYRGRANLWRMVKFIDDMPSMDNGDWNRSVRNFSMRLNGRGIVVLLSDFLDKGGYEEGFRYLLARNLDVYAIQILAQEEVEPNFSGDLKLTDAEDGDEAEITISAPLLERYQQTLAAFRASLAGFCSNRGMNYLFTTNQVPFEKLVLNYLRSRGLLR
ncbi:MAG: DUF58 domain-containing protein, partial [Gemmataceae bacterium]